MKIHNAMSMLELQNFLHAQGLSMHVDNVPSTGAWRVTLLKAGYVHGKAGIGRDIGEALANAYERLTEPVVS